MADKPNTSPNVISAGTTVEGKIRTQGSLRLDGKMTGEIHAAENLAIGVSGELDGLMNGRNITIGGKVRGNINAIEKLVLEGKSVVRGDIRAARLVIDEGAVFDGKVSMSENKPGQQNY